MYPTCKTKNSGRLVSALLTACLAAACDRAPPEPAITAAPPELPADHPAVGAAVPRLAAETVLAQVNDESITAGDLDAAIGAMPPADRLEYTSPEMTRDLLESLVDRKLMAAVARAELPAASAPGDEQALAGTWLEAALAKVPAPTGQDIADWYREHGAEFREPARVLVTRATAASEAVAGQLRGELARGATAGDLQGRAAGDVLSANQVWLQDVQKNPETTAIALALGQGEVSRVVPVPGGFLVMRADQVEPARQRPLAEVHAGIRASLADLRRQAAGTALHERLRNGARISVDESALMSYQGPGQAGL